MLMLDVQWNFQHCFNQKWIKVLWMTTLTWMTFERPLLSRCLLHVVTPTGDATFSLRSLFRMDQIRMWWRMEALFIFPREDVFLSGIIRLGRKILRLLSTCWQVTQLQATDAAVSGRCFPQIQSVFQGASPVCRAIKSHAAVAAAPFPRSTIWQCSRCQTDRFGWVGSPKPQRFTLRPVCLALV